MRIGEDEVLFRPVQKVIMEYLQSTESANVGRAAVTRAVVRDVLRVHGVKNLRDLRSEDVHSLLAEIELHAMGVTTYGAIAPPVEDNDEDEPQPRKEKRKDQMQLTIIIPSTHDAVAKDGLLQDRHFDAGRCVIVVHSVLTHHEGGNHTVSRITPAITVRHKNDMFAYATEPLSTEEFTRTFAAALRDAQIHAMQVTTFLADEVAKLVKKATIAANVKNAGTITETLLEVSGYLKRVRDGEQTAMVQKAGELFEKLGGLIL